MMQKTIKLIMSMMFCSIVLAAAEPKVVKLTPPILSEETILEKTYCTRPMRDGKFNISLEHINDKIVVNCYGHGGSGWTTLFGSVDKAIELFQKANPNKKTPIRVIGSGCMGLTAAIELSRLGYRIAGISTKELYDIPSWKAAGYFALVSVKTSPEEQEELNIIGLNTFLAYQKIEQGKHPYISKEAVRFIPVYCSIDTDAGVEDLEAKGLIPPKEKVTLDFGNGTIHKDFLKYMTYFMSTPILMTQLNAEIRKRGIDIQLDEIKSFDQIEEQVIFNCSGMGARELNADDKMIPVRGHLFALNEASGTAHMDYMIYTKVKQEGREEYVYMFPKPLLVSSKNHAGEPCYAVLGGSFIPNVDKLSPSEQAQVDKTEYQRMYDRNMEFFYGGMNR